MPVFDITSTVTRSDSVYDRGGRRFKNIMELVDWLNENVGEYYGPGEDHTQEDHESNANSGSSAIRIGAGWEIIRDWRGDPNGYVEVWWKLDITNEAKATLFALKWVK